VRESQSVIGGGQSGTFGFAEHRFGGFGRLKCFPCLALVVKELIPSMGVRRRGCHGGNESGSGDDQSHHGAGVSDACKKKWELVQKVYVTSHVGIHKFEMLLSRGGFREGRKRGKLPLLFKEELI
jgi:hypothetical protein